VNPTLDTCKEENLYRRDPQAEPPTSYPFHVTVALACPGALERRRREGRVQNYQYGLIVTSRFTLSCNSNLLPESLDLYMTKEAITERLTRRLSSEYDGWALDKFEPSLNTLPWSKCIARRDEFKKAMQDLLQPMIARAPSTYSGYDVRHHSEGVSCKFCRQEEPEEQRKVAAFEDLRADTGARCVDSDSSRDLGKRCLSEEHKQEQHSERSMSEYARSEQQKAFENMLEQIKQLGAFPRQAQCSPSQPLAPTVIDVEVDDIPPYGPAGRATVVLRECGLQQPEPQPFVPPMDRRLRV